MKGFALAFIVVIFVVGGITYDDYAKFCDCMKKLEKEVASYNEKTLKEINKLKAEIEARQVVVKSAIRQGSKYDWLINSLQEKIPANFEKAVDTGITAAMFDLRSKDEYWAIREIRTAFTDENGVGRPDLFEKYYNEKSEKYHEWSFYERSLLGSSASDHIMRNTALADPWNRSYASETGWSSGTLNEQCKTDNVILRLCGMEDHF